MLQKYTELNKEEKRVILGKGTERAFSGIYYNNNEKGIYHCKQCKIPLFRSESKFDSGSGWPSFDDSIDGNVNEKADKDGMRIEIICNNCQAHLGHVFKNESFTDNQTRHCVNSISLDFSAK
jgi:methionine-R-sulfoxide reductase